MVEIPKNYPKETPIKYPTVSAVRDHPGPCRRLVGTDGDRSGRTQISTVSSTESYQACMTDCMSPRHEPYGTPEAWEKP